jgi:hypothetical protein
MEVKIKLEKDIVEKVNNFADSINTDFYSTRGQSNTDKKKNDQQVGKLGEYGIYFYLKSQGFDVSEPDCKIYKAREKSWSPDLKVIDISADIHVKSQSFSSGERYGISWLFQKNDKHIFNTDTKNQYVAFVSVDNDECYVKNIVELQDLHNEKLFKEPKLDYLKNNKVAVYFKDIQHLEFAL